MFKFGHFDIVSLQHPIGHPTGRLVFQVTESLADHSCEGLEREVVMHRRVQSVGVFNVQLRSTPPGVRIDLCDDGDSCMPNLQPQREGAQPHGMLAGAQVRSRTHAVASGVQPVVRPNRGFAFARSFGRQLPMLRSGVLPQEHPHRTQRQRRGCGNRISGVADRSRRPTPARPAYAGQDESSKLRVGGFFNVVYLRGQGAFQYRRIIVTKIAAVHVSILDYDNGSACRTYFRHCFGEVDELPRPVAVRPLPYRVA